MALINEYFELTKKYQTDYGEKTILLMQVGSFFEVYGICNKKTNTISGSKITDFSQICELNIVDKNSCVGKDNVMMAGFKDLQIEKYIKKIQDGGFTAVVYVQDESAKNTTRSLAGIFSPGTYFPNESSALTNNVTCVWIELINNKMLLKGKYVVVGVANIDIYTGKTSIFQFKESYINNPTTYDELERYISIYNPSEVIIISNLSEKEVELESLRKELKQKENSISQREAELEDKLRDHVMNSEDYRMHESELKKLASEIRDWEGLHWKLKKTTTNGSNIRRPYRTNRDSRVY
jgi:DNA mismatch repair protein MutS